MFFKYKKYKQKCQEQDEMISVLRKTIYDLREELADTQNKVTDLRKELAQKNKMLGDLKAENEIYKKHCNLEREPTVEEMIRIRIDLKIHELEEKVQALTIANVSQCNYHAYMPYVPYPLNCWHYNY